MDELKRAAQNGGWERTDDGGVFIPALGAIARGKFVYNKRGEPEEFSDNILVDQGLTHMLGSALGGISQIPTWYIAIFGGDVTPLGSWTAANFTANATEITSYDETSRVEWTPTAAASRVISSFTAKSTFTASSAITVRGGALLSASAKSSTTGVLMGASRFGADKPLAVGEILDIGYAVELTPV